jgi:tRNA 5-methylaminomethyl-2-thiouridine biosynthesis bifunctional protein
MSAHVAIIGAGLAGASCAYMLKQAGMTPIIYESGPEAASGASGNRLGLYNPRLSAERSPESEFYTAAFQLALQHFAILPDIDWNPRGALHLMTDVQKQKRFPQTAANWGWGPQDMRIVSAKEASAIAGVPLTHAALYIARSGYVSPHKLVQHYLAGVEMHFNTPIENLDDIKADHIILCSAMDAARLTGLPLQGVRGQVTDIKTAPPLAALKTVLCYGGYTTPEQAGQHMCGSTFQRWLSHTDVLAEDDADNLAKLFAAAPALAGAYELAGARAAIRSTSPDHFPVVGHSRDNVYVSTAHGSHGILSSLMAAQMITDIISDNILSVPQEIIHKLSPKRFSSV